ncbi:hypothetical protein Bca4012_025326 [Brassica carinata]
MDSTKEGESLVMSGEMLLKIQQKIEKATSELKASGSSSSHLQNLSKEIQLLLMKTQEPSKPQIRDELDKVFAAEEVGHSCDLCQRDLASDPERPNASLRSLQEACVLSCGHVYHS